MLLQLLSLYASFLIYLLLFVQFVPDLRDKRLKVNEISSPALGRLRSPEVGGGGRVVLNISTNVYTWRLRPEVQPLTLLYTIFHEKSKPFFLPSFDKWYPFHIPCLELCIPLNFCKCKVF